jgi:hypothetical protein
VCCQRQLEPRATLQVLKIPSCRPCNLAKSKVDSELIAYLTIQRESGQHPESAKVFNDTVVRAVANNHVRLVDRFSSGWDIFDVDANGRLRPVGYAWQGDASAVFEAVRWIARGLHWVAYGQTIKDEWSRSKLIEGDQIMEMISKFSLCHTKRIFTQGEVFTCALVGTPDDTFNETLWAMSFFDSVLFLAATRVADPLSSLGDTSR